MTLFRRRDPREADPDSKADRSRYEHPAGRAAMSGLRLHPRVKARTPLSDDDWLQISRLLDGGASGPPADDIKARVASAVELLRSYVDGPVVGVSPVLNQLLDIWELAQNIDPRVARPAETLMSALVGREFVGADEVQSTCSEILTKIWQEGVDGSRDVRLHLRSVEDRAR